MHLIQIGSTNTLWPKFCQYIQQQDAGIVEESNVLDRYCEQKIRSALMDPSIVGFRGSDALCFDWQSPRSKHFAHIQTAAHFSNCVVYHHATMWCIHPCAGLWCSFRAVAVFPVALDFDCLLPPIHTPSLLSAQEIRQMVSLTTRAQREGWSDPATLLAIRLVPSIGISYTYDDLQLYYHYQRNFKQCLHAIHTRSTHLLENDDTWQRMKAKAQKLLQN